MAVIKSGASTDQWTIDPASKAGRVTIYDSTGAVLSPATDTTLTGGTAKMQMWDGSNILGTTLHPVVVSSALAQDTIASGTISSSPVENVEINVQGSGSVLISISGTWVGTLVFEASADGTNWNTAVVFPKPSTTAAVTSTTTNGAWVFPSSAASKFRVRASAWSSGSATIHLEAGQTTQVVEVYQLYEGNLHTTAHCIGTLLDETPLASATQNIGALTSHATAFEYAHKQDEVGFLHTDLLGNLRTRSSSESVLGDLVTIPRLNQIEINFSEGLDPLQITTSASGTGSFAISDGTSVWATGGAITGRATGVTTQQLKYHPGHEWFCLFTADFTNPTDGFNPNYQRIGPYNTTDGFFIGWEKDVFCFSQFQNNVITSIPKASWNGDPADGTTNSAYTRLGVPEVLHFDRINIYRIRGSWFGTAPVELQVFSPDMVWITLHTFHFPNTLNLPFAFTTNWNITIDVFKSGSDSTDLQLHSPCIAMGTNNDTSAINEPLTDFAQAKLVRSVLTGKNVSTGDYTNVGLSTENAVTVSGSGQAVLDTAVWNSTTPQDTFVEPLNNDYNHNTVTVALVATSPISAGAITFEASIDNIHFLGVTGVDISTGLAMPSAVVNISAGSTKIFVFNVSGFNYFRYRLSTAITGAGTVTSSYLLQGLSSPSVSTTITTGSITVGSNQGSPNSLGNAWPMEITDGTRGPAAIKAASTAAIATDPALVVAISPNNSVAVTGTFFPATQPVSGTVAVTQSTSPWITSDNHFTHNLNQDGSGNVGVNVQNFPGSTTISGSVTAQLLDVGGVNKVSIDSSNRLAIVITDGSDVTLGAKADARSTATDVTAVSIMSVLKEISFMEQNPASRAVTNAGTFAVQEATLDAALIAQEATTAGVKGLTIFGAVTTNAPTYVTGKSDALSLDTAGLLRVSLKDTPANTNKFLVTADPITFASPQHVILDAGAAVIGHVITDATSVTNATLSAETTKVIGVTRTADGAGNLLTSNSTTPAAHFALDTNITSILGTAPTTVGKLDIKGADGDVFVRQATAANLNATVVGNLTHNNAAPTTNNIGVLPALANAVAPTFTEADQVLLSTDLSGSLRVASRPAAPTTAKWSHAIIAVSAATGVQTLVGLVAGQTIRVMKIQFTTDKATNITFLDSTPTNLSGTYVLTGNGSSFSDNGDGEPLWVGAVGKSFQVNLSGTVTLGGDIWYTQS